MLCELLEEALSPVAPGKNQSLESSRDPTRGHRRAWGRRVATCWNHGVGHTHRVGARHLGEDGRTHHERKGFVGSHPHGTRPAARLADLAPERKSQSQPHDAHNAPGSSASYCQTHDEGIWATAKVLLDGLPAADETAETEWPLLATLPMRMGGLGLRCPLTLALWSKCRSRFLARANDSGVHRPSSLVQGSVAGALATSIALDGSNVQWMPRAAGPTRKTPGSLHTHRTNQEEVITDRAGARASVS